MKCSEVALIGAPGRWSCTYCCDETPAENKLAVFSGHPVPVIVVED